MSYRLYLGAIKKTRHQELLGKTHQELVKEFGDKQEDDTIKVTDPAKLTLFIEKHAELLSTEDEVEFEKIKIDDLGDIAVPTKLLVDFIFE